MAPIALNADGQTDGRTDRRTDGRYQVHYLPRFAVDNQRCKARKVSFVPRLLDMTLLEHQAPLLGRLR